MKGYKRHRVRSRRALNNRVLAVAVAACLGLGSGNALAQSTTGSIFGVVKGDVAHDTVVVQGSNGVSRQLPLDPDGRYNFGALPLGTYTVTLKQGDQVVGTREEVVLRVNAGVQVDFNASNAKSAATGATELQSVKVTATSSPIDVSSVDSRTVITSEQLDSLPLGRTAEDISLLAPGTVSSGSLFSSRIGAGSGNLVSFGGSSAAENAYYVNGFNTTDPYKGLGGLALPYGAIAQQEVLTGGYGASFGRSDGGVISQVGKSGTDEWHFGFQAQWTPESTMSSPNNIDYANNRYSGQLYQYRNKDKAWTTTYSAYFGGALLPQHLYLFGAVESSKTDGSSTSTSDASSPYRSHYHTSNPKWYAKLNWNINDNNLLELTEVSNKRRYSGYNNGFDYNTQTEQGFNSYSDISKTGGNLFIGKFTSYITDNLTLTALYGKMHLKDYSAPVGYNASLPYLDNIADEDPALTGGKSIGNSQSTYSLSDPDQGSRSQNLRVDLQYRLGDRHTLLLGIDNQILRTIDVGGNSSSWTYAQSGNPNAAIDPDSGIGAAGGNGYYVMNEVVTGAASVKTVEHAQYLEDNWQATDNLLVTMGIRNDAFANYNNSGVKFTDQKHNFSPRFGFSWDVYGDSSMKVYGNAGRYYLAINNNTAYDGATGYAWSRSYYTYNGIDSDGMPTGLSEIGSTYVNGHTGQAPDPKTVVATNLGAEYQDEFILGLTKSFNNDWVAGVKGTYRILRQSTDDVCDSAGLLASKAESMYGLSADQITSTGGCYIFNPGKTNVFSVATTNGYVSVPMSNSDWGFTDKPKRDYYSLELFLERPLADNRWGGKLDYVFSRSYGNTEGLIRSVSGTDSVGVTSDWDNRYVMSNANGLLGNNRKHQFKAYGTLRISPEWMLSGVMTLASGAPKSCLGFYGTDQTQPDSYGSKYHWCNGQPSPPGSLGSLPWTYRLDLNLSYRPAFAHGRLAFNASVFNVFNEQHALALYEYYNSTSTPSALSDTWGTARVLEDPRYARFSMTYDF